MDKLEELYQEELKNIPVREHIHGANVQLQNPMADENLISFSALTPPENVLARKFYDATREGDFYNKAVASIYGVDLPVVVLSPANIGINKMQNMAECERLMGNGLAKHTVTPKFNEIFKVAQNEKFIKNACMFDYRSVDAALPVFIVGNKVKDTFSESIIFDTRARLIKGDLSNEGEQQNIFHHEYAHVMSYDEHLQETGETRYSDEEYKYYLEECRGDSQGALMMIKQGADIEILDSILVGRTLRAVYKNDVTHFTGHTLQGLKENINVDEIRNMSIEEIAEYAENNVIEYAMNEEDYNDFVQAIEGDYDAFSEVDQLRTVLRKSMKILNVNDSYCQTTPLEAEKILEEAPEAFSTQQKEFLEEFYIPMKDVYVTARDFENGLTNHPVAEELHYEKFKEDNQHLVTACEELETSLDEALEKDDVTIKPSHER